MKGNLIPLIDTSAFGEDMFDGLEEINGEKFIPVYNLGKLREFAEKIADKIVEASENVALEINSREEMANRSETEFKNDMLMF